jgi:RecA/RadA recombinase
MDNILDRLKKNSTIEDTSVLSKSQFFGEKDVVVTDVPILNIALGGSLNGGLGPGLTMFAGPSKHFKTALGLLCVSAYLKKYPDAICLFYDSEFGSPQSYFDSFGIDTNRVLHTPVVDVEQLRSDIANQLQEISREDKVIIMIDSIGNLASHKEAQDAIDQKSVADMTRAKQIKSLFRIVTPYLTTKNIPMLVVNHTYKEMSMYPRDIVSGGTGSYYSSQNIFIIGRQKEKEGKDLKGYRFIIKVEKSREVKEESKIPLEVSLDHGISKWSGLIDIAIEAGFIVKPKQGWYACVNQETGEIEEKNYRLKDTYNKEFWSPILENEKFQTWIEQKYRYNKIVEDDETN